MNHIKPLLLALCLVSSASAQSHLSQSFLNVRSCQVSNLFQITNLLSTGTQFTNKLGTVWTNLSGTKIIVGSTNSGQYQNVFKDVSLWSDRNGNPTHTYFPTPPANAQSTNSFIRGGATVFLRVTANNAAANSAVTFLFSPVWDGQTDTYLATADHWSVAVTAAGTTPVTLATNAPTWLWPGAKALRLSRVSNADTDADSEVIVTHASFNGFQP